MSTLRIVRRQERDADAERRALIAGLRASPARVAPKYFYDALGCALYGAICELPEYYLTRTERSIFDAHRGEIAREIPRGGQFVDIGAGDCKKGEAWLDWVEPSRYVAVDIAGDAISEALARIAPRFPSIEMLGIVTDFGDGLDIREDLDATPATFFYPGSSIGNFTPDEALRFIAGIRRHCTVPGSSLLIGVDLVKPAARIEAAYADALGVTAAFNRNALNHVNRLIGSDFVASAWRHCAFYNDARSRVEMHLEAMATEVVRIGDASRTFAAGERIHTENSCKYTPEAFAAMLGDAGFGRVRRWMDPARDFAVFLAQ
jgi:dimethylhistidine N-methyltransferase